MPADALKAPVFNAFTKPSKGWLRRQAIRDRQRPLFQRRAPLGCAPKPARGVASDGVAPHARLARAHALAEIFRFIGRVVLRDTETLFGRVVRFLRACRKAGGKKETANQTSQLHVPLPFLSAPRPTGLGRA